MVLTFEYLLAAFFFLLPFRHHVVLSLDLICEPDSVVGNREALLNPAPVVFFIWEEK